ncbi:Auxin-responsive protein SAUR32 [Linum grandiflorum]
MGSNRSEIDHHRHTTMTATATTTAADTDGGGKQSHHHFHFHIHFPHLDLFHHHNNNGSGRVAIIVGEEGEEQQRFVIPVIYINHPLFHRLLKVAEDEFDFHYKEGPITIPCHVEEFRNIQGLIDQDQHNHNHHHHHHHLLCFWV